MEKRVLFSANTTLDIYKDVIQALNEKGYHVVYVKNVFKRNPFQPIFYPHCSESDVTTYLGKVDEYWKHFFESVDPGPFDYFFSINGLMVSPYLFETLKRINPNIKCKLFIYDKIEFACRVNLFFKYYDDVFTFDLEDARKYSIHHLPIYWVPGSTCPKKYDVFGMASYSLHKKNRADLFRRIRYIVKHSGFSYYIKLYVRMDNWFTFILKNFVKMVFRHRRYIPFIDVFSGLVTSKPLSPTQFRKCIYESLVILDTHVDYQDGLTARFMWALGAGKKVITTNMSVKDYPFYNDNQFFILSDNLNRLPAFIKAPLQIPDENRLIIDSYRIDNWLDIILGVRDYPDITSDSLS